MVAPLYNQYPNLLAGNQAISNFLPFELWAGESDIVTSQGTVGAAAVRQFAVIMRTSATDPTIIEWDGNAAHKPIGFAAQAGAPSSPIPYYTGGVPNHSSLIWPSAVNTLDLRKAAFDGTNMTIGSILGADPNYQTL